MGKNKLVRKNGMISFESDEKKSIIIALVVSAVVVLATVVAFIAIRRHGNANNTVTSEEVVDTYTVSEKIADDGSIIVTNQAELDTKLTESATDSSIGAITIQSEEEQVIEIPDGNYSQLALNIDAPYTEVSNYALFNTINISQISANTWIEHGTGNTIVLQSDASHIIVEEDGSVDSISNINYGSTLAIEIYGTVRELSLEAEESISSISVEGHLDNLDIYRKTNLVLSGAGTETLPVRLQDGADGTVLKTSVPIDMVSSGTVDLYMQEGSEESRLSVTNSNVITNVNNNTTADLSVVDPDNKEIVVPVGENKSFGEIKEPEEVAASNPTTSNSTNSSTVSSGNGGGRAATSGSGSSSTASTVTQTQTQTPTPAPTPAPTPTPTPKPTPTPTPKPTSSASTNTQTQKINDLTSKVNSLTESLKKLTTKSDEMEKKLGETEKKLVDANKKLEEKEEEYLDNIIEAARSAVIDVPLPDSLEKKVNEDEGGIIYRAFNDDVTFAPYESDNPNTAEYIMVKNAEESNKKYLVQLFYYYFVKVDDGEGSRLVWNEMGTSKSAVLSPGDKWFFARKNPTNPNVEKYFIEIVTKEYTPAEASETNPDQPLGEEITVPVDGAEKRYANAKYIQAVFMKNDKVVGITIYNLLDESKYTDMDINPENIVRETENGELIFGVTQGQEEARPPIYYVL